MSLDLVPLSYIANDGSTVSWAVDTFETRMPTHLQSQKHVIEEYLAYESDFAQGVVNAVNEEAQNEDSPIRELIRSSQDTEGDHYAEVGYDTWSGSTTIVTTFNGEGDLTTHALFKREVSLDFEQLRCTMVDLLAEQVSEPDEDYDDDC